MTNVSDENVSVSEEDTNVSEADMNVDANDKQMSLKKVPSVSEENVKRL